MRIRNRQPLLAAAAAAFFLAACGGAGGAGAKAEAEALEVGGLPVTCNLSLPVACMAMQNAHADSGKGGGVAMGGMDMGDASMGDTAMGGMSMDKMDGMSIGGLAVYRKYNGWPELKEALMSGRLQAAYLLAPMAMELADRGIPVRVVAIGHRSGAVIMVGSRNPARNIGDLKGKRIAIPSRFAVDYLFVRRMMQKHGLKEGDIEFVEMPPPDMPVALHTGGVDGYATGEPFGAKAQMAGYARPLHITRDEWPDYICCVLTVRQELIDQHPEQVQNLVNYVISAGDWLDSNQANRHTAAALASHPSFFGQDPKVLRFVMDNPPDRVTYGDLRLVRFEFDAVMRMAAEAGVLPRPVPYERYTDERFMRAFTPKTIRVNAGDSQK
ncbi:MAG TPA: ABC transporter substrate-binding protein [Longimicrobium sp.]